jgi:phosphohistidine phosphatase
MILYLLRHAKALPRQAKIPEEQRYLTEEGRERFTQAALRLREEGMKPDLILTSALLRSVQTAEILAGVLAFSGPLLVEPQLAPGFGRRQLARLLKEHAEAGEMVVVGHEPDLSLLVTSLLGIKAHFNLKKGDVVALDLDADGKASLRWRTFRGEPTTTLVDGRK